MAAGMKAGVSNKFYRNTATWGTPTWDEITAAKDVALNIEMGKADVKSRGSNFVQTLPTVATVRATWNMIADTSIADYDILRDACLAKTLINFAVADFTIATSGTEYFKFDGYVYGFNLTQNLEEGNMVDCSAEPAYSANVPLWTNVA